jgi:hypothetical protein
MAQKFFLIKHTDYCEIVMKDKDNKLIEVARSRFENLATEICRLANKQFDAVEEREK